jgi:hypothetical protein
VTLQGKSVVAKQLFRRESKELLAQTERSARQHDWISDSPIAIATRCFAKGERKEKAVPCSLGRLD